MRVECIIEYENFVNIALEQIYIQSMYNKGYELKFILPPSDYGIWKTYYWIKESHEIIRTERSGEANKGFEK